MTSALWIVTAVMAAMALIFVMRPLAGRKPGLPRAGIAVAILVPGIAIGLYSYLGSPEAANSDVVHGAADQQTDGECTVSGAGQEY